VSTRHEPAGDVDYERHGAGYATMRREDRTIAAAVRAAIGDATTVLNVGAGAGSYEPSDLDVTAVEPAAAMRAQRPAHKVRAIDAVAEDLPFPDGTFDASMASITIHQWRDLERGLAELRRVTSGPVVVLTFEPDALLRFWLTDFAPQMMSHEAGRMPRLETVADLLGGEVDVVTIPIPRGCADGFAEAFFGRPEAFLEPDVRAAQSAWSFVGSDVVTASVEALSGALDDGRWDAEHGSLRGAERFEGSLRLLTARPAGRTGPLAFRSLDP
jgi:SAM-dependent methyltransferase